MLFAANLRFSFKQKNDIALDGEPVRLELAPLPAGLVSRLPFQRQSEKWRARLPAPVARDLAPAL